MSKFFVHQNQIANGYATLTGADVNHIVKVLRAQVGEFLLLCDGEGMDYETQICNFSREAVTVKICKAYPCLTEPKIHVTLYQGIPKQGKMEWIIEKCTEMGISAIVPVQMERSVVHLTTDSAEKKLDRWYKTAEAAAKQCGRGKIPAVSMPIAIEQLTKESLPSLLLMPYEGEQVTPIRQVISTTKADSVGIFIGPEGGFTSKEVSFLLEQGAQSVTLGRRILRTETAGLAVLTMLMYERDELSY
ncbi:MAG: 16S rRNA (uracil(1498)-N(3))-methyltransferase [Ruminococcaceae bacterium]|nr:16S rRNA (uracil(1498)-N(3))-methyltransferase [Oscillospiraceae bacterium]